MGQTTLDELVELLRSHRIQRTMNNQSAQQPTAPVAIDASLGRDACSSSVVPPAATHPQVSYQSMDSEELSALEEMAEHESESDTEIERLLDEAASAFPPDVVTLMVKHLKQHGIVSFLQRYVLPEPSSLRIKQLLLALGVFLPRSIRESEPRLEQLLPILNTALARMLRRRQKLVEYNTISDALHLLSTRKRIVVLSGAGISVSCGIPDFRSKTGIYSQLQQQAKYELDDPHDMFDKHYFLANPAVFYSFAHTIFPTNFVPSPAHRFIRLIEQSGRLLRNYSQNIDTLEQVAGIQSVLQCHGSFASATCTDPSCGFRCNGSFIAKHIFAQSVPACPRCEERKLAQTRNAKPSNKKRKLRNRNSWKPDDTDDEDEEHAHDSKLAGFGILKPDITFFGEKLSDAFDRALLADREQVDLLIVMGTSLKVAPVSEMLAHIPHSTPVILINKTPILHMATDIMLLGDCDRIVEYLCAKLDWHLPSIQPNQDVVGPPAAQHVNQKVEQDDRERNAPSSVDLGMAEPERLMNSHAWLFEGAEPGRLPALLAEMQQDDDDDDDDDDDESEHEETPTTDATQPSSSARDHT